MSVPPHRKYSIEPLLKFAGVTTANELAKVTNQNRANCHKYINRGWITSKACDTLACSLNITPHLIWPDWK